MRIFQNDYYYHIYNRGVDKREVFCDEKDYSRFLISMKEFNNVTPTGSLYQFSQLKKEKPLKGPYGLLKAEESRPLVEIICYSLLPNHYHFLLKQKREKGIVLFMQRLGNGYTQHFNYKYDRSGSLFQGTYKSIHIKSDSYLNYLSAYIHGNPEIHKIAKAEEWIWSSYQDYLGKRNGTLINKNIVLQDFKNTEDYKNYTDLVIVESGQRKDEIKNYFLE